MTTKEALSVLSFIDSIQIINEKPYVNVKEISKVLSMIDQEDDTFISLDYLKKYLKDFDSCTSKKPTPKKKTSTPKKETSV